MKNSSNIPFPPPAYPYVYKYPTRPYPPESRPEAVMVRSKNSEIDREREISRVNKSMAEEHGGHRLIPPIPHHFAVVFARTGAALGAAGALLAGIAGGEMYRQRTKAASSRTASFRDACTFLAGFGAGSLAQQAIGVFQSSPYFVIHHPSFSKYFDYIAIGVMALIAIGGGIYSIRQFNNVSNLSNDDKKDDAIRASDIGEAVSLAFVGAAFGFIVSAVFHYLSINDHIPPNSAEDGEHVIWCLQAKAAVYGVAAFLASIAAFIVYDGTGQRHPELLILTIFALILGVGAIIGAILPFMTTGVAVEAKRFPES